MVSVVVPTRNESDNVGPLVERLRTALGEMPGEIVFVDDSDDDTPEVIASLADDDIRLVHRTAGHRDGGLGGAVAAGFAAAQAPWVVVMDGDLQHPPETVPDLLTAGRNETAQAVVASRYLDRGRVDGLGGLFRRFASRATGLAAKVLFPRRLRTVTDPMSGFFAIRRDAIRPEELRPDGYKILLEVLVRNRVERIAEVPYTFQPRTAGDSKASLREGLRYGRHLAGLRVATLRHPRSATGRMLGFALAGAAGTAVNSAALWALGEVAGLPYLVAAFLAVQVAIIWNFVVVDNLVMPPGERTRGHRFGRFLLLNNTLTPVHLGLLFALVQLGGLHYLGANVLAIVVVFLLRYVVTTSWVYGTPNDLMNTVRRTAQVRLLLALVLTAVAFPALLTAGWAGVGTRGDTVPLIIPLAAAVALVAGRLRPSDHEPNVHDRQTDGLIATACMVAAAALLIFSSLDKAAALFYLGGAAILLVGTRTAARLRWVLLLLPIAAVSSASVRNTVDDALSSIIQTLGQPAGPINSADGLSINSLLLERGQLPGLALFGAIACLVISALIISGFSRSALVRIVAGTLTVIAVTVGAILTVLLAGRLFGPEAFRIAQKPIFIDLALAATVTIFIARWSPMKNGNSAMFLPRARFALLTLGSVAIALSAGAAL
ncbi:putative flippase GtrA [Actinoplanes lutulentus]|nr:glycosyltransferase [Actinoplanes lutulentus]MBB2941359.1 putative flippase GtrA [Actinoplanes lutulentus]